MNGRNRVLAAIEHREPDRVPLDLGTTDTLMARDVYLGLAKLLGIEPQPHRVLPLFDYVTPDENTLRMLGIDVRLAYSCPPRPPAREVTLPDGTIEWSYLNGPVFRKPPGSSDFQLHRPTVSGSLSRDTIDRYLPPQPSSEVWYDPLPAKDIVRDYHENGLAVQAQCILMPVTGTSTGFLNFEQWALEFASQPETVCYLMDRFLEYLYVQSEPFYQALGDCVDVQYAIGDDLASQLALWVSPTSYRKYIKPRHRKIMEYLRKRTTGKIIFHCCGAAQEIISDLIEIGVDILNPIQTICPGMNPFRLKKDFGSDIAFWGGIDVMHLLPHGKPHEIEREVKRHIDALAPGGGYVLGPSHIIQKGTPPENVLAMYRTATEYGKQ